MPGYRIMLLEEGDDTPQILQMVSTGLVRKLDEWQGLLQNGSKEQR